MPGTRSLATLARDVDGAWQTLETLVATSAYEKALALAADLEALARSSGEEQAFANRFEAMRKRQLRRRGFFDKWKARASS